MATSLDPSAILGQLTEGYLKLPLVQKILFPILVVASVMGIIYVSKWASRPDYSVLYSDLSSADAAAVVERLKAQKIKYQLRGDGSSIAVSPAELVHELRIGLASEGLPKGGTVGFELFDNSSFGTTTFVERLKFIRAIQGELERTIGALDSVRSARVHVTQPERTVFAREKSLPTASVMLRLRAGGELEKKQIQGIANLVAGSVEGLLVENVKIIDIYGNLLTPQDQEKEELGLEATRLQYQREVERSYVERVEQMLSRVLGPGKVIARVTADLDFSANEREEESYDPGGQVIRSERSIDEGSGTSMRGGVPGVVSNISDDPKLLAPPGSGNEDSRRSESLKNYEVSKAVNRTSSPRGRLLKVSVAVLVDGTYESVNAAEAAVDAGKGAFKPLDSDVMAQIESLVKSAVGYDMARGDTVTVENIPFHTPEVDFSEQMDTKEMQDLIFNGLSKGVPILFVILFFLVVVKPLVKFLVTPTEAEVDLTRLLPTGIEELERELDSERQKAQIPTYEPAVDLDQLEDLMAENSRLVKENPHQAALLIRYWLNDGRL